MITPDEFLYAVVGKPPAQAIEALVTVPGVVDAMDVTPVDIAARNGFHAVIKDTDGKFAVYRVTP